MADLDDSTARVDHGEGFAGQRLCVVPRPLVRAAGTRPVTRRLVVTDAGYFPSAAGHLRQRPRGSDEAILLLCVRGEGWVCLGGEREAMRPGGCVLLPPRTSHSYGASSEHPWTIWWCHLGGSDVRDVAAVLGERVTVLGSLDRVVAQFDELVTTLERGQTPAHLLAASGVAWHLVAQVAADRVLPAARTPVERAMRYLADRTDAHVQVDDLADLVGLSASHLTALFRQATGGGIVAYHTSLRMACARALLDTTDQPVAQVARLVGYDDPLYFSRQFRRRHGQSPTAYRAQHKG